MSSQDIGGCITASKAKLEGILSLGDQLISDLPAAYLETYEFLAIGKVSSRFLNNIFQFYMIWFQALKLKVEDPEVYRQKAEELSKKFGDKFTEGYNTKLQEILYGSW